MIIDIHTLAIVLSLTYVLQVIALFSQYRLDKTYSGLGWWTLGTAALAMGFAFNYLRDNPSVGGAAIIANNVLFFAGLVLIYVGVLRFLDQRERRGQIIGFCAVFTLVIIYFTYSFDSQVARWVLISLAVSVISFFIARALFMHKTRSVTALANLLAIVFLVTSALFAMRALAPFMGEAVNGVFSPTLIHTATYLVVLITSTLWTFGAIILVNQRLNAENREAKENADLIFNTSPDAVLITRVTDGHFVNLNDGFTTLTGFTRAEVLGKSILEVNIWKNLADRQIVIALLNKKGSCENLQAVFQRKDGSLLIGLLSARIIVLRGVPHIISVTHDITERQRAEEEKLNANVRLRTLSMAIEQSPVTTVITDLAGNIVSVSPKFTETTGYTAEEAIGQNPRFLKTGFTSSAAYKELWDTILSGQNWHGIFHNKRKNGEMYWESSTISPVRDEQGGAITHFLAVKEDITARKQAEEALQKNATELEHANNRLEIAITNANELTTQAILIQETIREREARYRAVFDSVNDAIISADGAGDIVDWNPGAERIFGYSKIEACGRSIALLMPARHHTGHFNGIERIQTGGEKHVIGKTVELEGRRKDGSEFPMELSLSEWHVADQMFFTAVIRDITESRRLKEELQQQATTDELTKVSNRRNFLKLALPELTRAIRLKRTLAIVLIDIDHFKDVNDTLGHAVGDQVLMTFTKICQKNIREIDLFARFGGDEFVLLLPEAGPEQAHVVTERIRTAITVTPFDLGGTLVSITISSGIANLSGDEETFDELLSRADQALYRAKKTGRNQVVVYEEL
jgi:diguanylate cyclase (GGDEF)-like protein/PAS domain S-box-containing protein